MGKKIRISTSDRHPAIVIHKGGIPQDRLVYIALANKPVRYPQSGKRSRIVYIGTTEQGLNRIMSSGAKRAREIFEEHGIKRLEFFTVYCRSGRQGFKIWWVKLERAMIQAFKDSFYQLPRLNTQGKKDWSTYYKYFSERRVKKLVSDFSNKS